MIKSTRVFLLAGASALAILASAAEANAETFTMPAMFSFTAAVSGEYAVELLGASGGNSTIFAPADGGLGAEVSGDVFLTAGEDLTLFVGGQGGSATFGGGGGGGSFVFHGADVLAVAGGGGGGAAFGNSSGGPGLAGTSGGTGKGIPGVINGGVGGTGGGGGSGGQYGGGGAGVNAGFAGYGGDGVDAGTLGGFGGKFPNGGAGGRIGGGGGDAGGGGSGFSGGGGGSGAFGGGGGGSYLKSLFTDQVLTAGVNRGEGSISITSLTPAVPEPSTWAMMLMGFAGLGWLAHARRRKTSPA